MNEERFLLIPLLGLLGAVPLLLLTAAVRGRTAGAVAGRLASAIARGFGVTRGRLPRLLASTGAIILVLGHLFGLAAILNERGDEVMPVVSRLAGHFGDPLVAWIHEHDRDWVKFKNDFRAAHSRVHPGRDIDGDKAGWLRWKNDHGRNAVRAARILVLYGALLMLAGLIDLVRRPFRRRGAALLFLGAAAIALFSLLWADREAAFVREVAAANARLGEDAARLPPSWPGNAD